MVNRKLPFPVVLLKVNYTHGTLPPDAAVPASVAVTCYNVLRTSALQNGEDLCPFPPGYEALPVLLPLCGSRVVRITGLPVWSGVTLVS